MDISSSVWTRGMLDANMLAACWMNFRHVTSKILSLQLLPETKTAQKITSRKVSKYSNPILWSSLPRFPCLLSGAIIWTLKPLKLCTPWNNSFILDSRASTSIEFRLRYLPTGFTQLFLSSSSQQKSLLGHLGSKIKSETYN